MYVKHPLRNVEDLLTERGIDIRYETVPYWRNRFGPMFAADIRKSRASRICGYIQWSPRKRADPVALKCLTRIMKKYRWPKNVVMDRQSS
jgi:hypothetical protein